MTEEEIRSRWLDNKSCDVLLYLFIHDEKLSKSMPSSRRLRLFACACMRKVWYELSEELQNLVITVEKVANKEANLEELSYKREQQVFTPYNNTMPIPVPTWVGSTDAMSAARNTCYSIDEYIAQSRVRTEFVTNPVEPYNPHYSTKQICARRKSLEILHDIIDNPFNPITLPLGDVCKLCHGTGGVGEDDVSCLVCSGTGYTASPVLTPTVLALAKEAYASRSVHNVLQYEQLLVLSDALEDAGLPASKICDACKGKGYFEGSNWSATCTQCIGDKSIGTGYVTNPILKHLRDPKPHFYGCHVLELLLGYK